MKYLLVFYFAGFFLANAVEIKKYKLRLKPEEDEFQGIVTLTLSNSNNNHDVELDSYTYQVTKCTYTGNENLIKPSPDLLNEESAPTTTEQPTTTTTEQPTTTTTKPPATTTTEQQTTTTTKPPPEEQNCIFEDNKIKFNGYRTSEEVVLEFKGKYRRDGLSKYTTESKDRFYVADMTAEDRAIIFPCQEKIKAQFEFEGDGVVMSNLENLRQKDENKEVFLRDITFVQGDIAKDGESVKSLPYYHMKTSEKMGQKLKNVMEKVAELDPSLKILFTPLSEEIPIISRDVIILSGVHLKSNDSGSDYSDISHKLANKLFQRPKGEKKTFFDIVGPEFAAMKILGENDFHSEWGKMSAFEEDGFNNSRSLNDLASKNQGTSLLYGKGIPVLHSLEAICGPKKFTEGLSNYISNGSSTVNETFEGCFENKEKAEEFFKVWTDYPGYPVVNVILNKTGQYDMNQERFLWFGSEEKDRKWVIPIDYKTKEGSLKNIMLPATEKNVTVTINSTYFILNHNNKGFYRVNYDASLWEALISQLKSNHTQIDPVSRVKLIDDVFSFPKSTYNFTHGVPDYVTALKLSEYLKNETDFYALQIAFRALDFLDSALNSSYHGKFRDHMKGILSGLYNKTTKVKDSGLQDQVYLLACKFGVEECIKNATMTFREITLNTTQLSPRQKLAICTVVRNDSSKWMESLVLLSAMGITPDEKNFLLGCSRDEKTLSLFLTQFITLKDELGFYRAVSNAMFHNPDNIKVILGIIKRFEHGIIKVFGKNCLKEIVRFTLPKLNSESAVTLKEIAKNLDEQLEKDVNRECENVKLWTDTKARSVGEYFSGSGSESQAKPITLLLLVTTLLPLANRIFHS